MMKRIVTKLANLTSFNVTMDIAYHKSSNVISTQTALVVKTRRTVKIPLVFQMNSDVKRGSVFLQNLFVMVIQTVQMVRMRRGIVPQSAQLQLRRVSLSATEVRCALRVRMYAMVTKTVHMEKTKRAVVKITLSVVRVVNVSQGAICVIILLTARMVKMKKTVPLQQSLPPPLH